MQEAFENENGMVQNLATFFRTHINGYFSNHQEVFDIMKMIADAFPYEAITEKCVDRLQSTNLSLRISFGIYKTLELIINDTFRIYPSHTSLILSKILISLNYQNTVFSTLLDFCKSKNFFPDLSFPDHSDFCRIAKGQIAKDRLIVLKNRGWLNCLYDSHLYLMEILYMIYTYLEVPVNLKLISIYLMNICLPKRQKSRFVVVRYTSILYFLMLCIKVMPNTST